MSDYEYGRIKVLARELDKAGLPEETKAFILMDGHTIAKSACPEKKAEWFRGAMERMDAKVDYPTRRDIREACACCLGGKREKLSRQIAKDHSTFEARIAAANDTPFVFGSSVKVMEDGRILVSFCSEDNPGPFRCVCLPKSKEPISPTYCLCCGGHIKHHLQNALNEKLEMSVASSALSSGGKEMCRFAFKRLSGCFGNSDSVPADQSPHVPGT